MRGAEARVAKRLGLELRQSRRFRATWNEELESVIRLFSSRSLAQTPSAWRGGKQGAQTSTLRAGTSTSVGSMPRGSISYEIQKMRLTMQTHGNQVMTYGGKPVLGLQGSVSLDTSEEESRKISHDE